MVIKIKKSFLIIFIIILLILIFVLINVILNFSYFVNTYTIEDSKIPNNFNGFKIVQLSDIHSIRNEKKLNTLLKKIKKQEPDIIVLTGDFIDSGYYIDSYNKNLMNNSDEVCDKLTVDFAEQLVKIAPTYYIYGNHEMVLLDDVENNKFKNALINVGVDIINNEQRKVELNGESINLIGIQDPSTLYKDSTFNEYDNSIKKTQKELDIVTENLDLSKFTILLSHRPEYFELYSKYKFDLILSGHAHGGQIRLPFIGGLYAPNQGWFPKYTKGLYKDNNSIMIVSAGLGNSIAPVRIFDPFEIVTLKLLRNLK